MKKKKYIKTDKIIKELNDIFEMDSEGLDREIDKLLYHYNIPLKYRDKVKSKLRDQIRNKIRKEGLPNDEWLEDILFKLYIKLGKVSLCDENE